MKNLKFKSNLIPLILSGMKKSTWRMFDDKDLRERDEINLINGDTGESIGKAIITSIREKKLGEIEQSDFDGHEKYESKEEMYRTYRGYYGDKVSSDTIVKMIDFEFKK